MTFMICLAEAVSGMSSGGSWIDDGESKFIEVDGIGESLNGTVDIFADALFLAFKV